MFSTRFLWNTLTNFNNSITTEEIYFLSKTIYNAINRTEISDFFFKLIYFIQEQL